MSVSRNPLRASSVRSGVTAATVGLLATLFASSAAIAATTPSSASGNSATDMSAPATTAPQRQQSKDDGRRYCARINLTGSFITRKTCKTRAEWAVQGVDVNDLNR